MTIFYIIDSMAISVHITHASIQNHLQDRSVKPSLIVIDNLQAVTANEAVPEQETDEIIRVLKSLAAELDQPIILVSRLDHSKIRHD